jgi:glycosyltransferase involved in cell wall biosynthesis
MSYINYWKEQKGFPGLQRKLKILVFVPNYGGCAYYRVLMPFSVLAKLYSNVVEVKFDQNPLRWNEKTKQEEFDPEVFNWPDIVVTNNIPDKGMNYLARVLGKTKEANKIFWFDTDDLLTELYAGHRLESVYKEQKLSENTKFVYYNSDLVSVTQDKFAQRIRPFCGNKTLLSILKNAIDYTLPCWNAPKVVVPKDKFVRVGWAGGIHHEEDVKEFAGIPWTVNQRVGKENVRWDFYGKPPLDPTNPEKWQHDVWKNYERTLAAGFKAYKNYTINPAMNPNDSVDSKGRTIPGYGHMFANMDVGIAPLQMNSFNDSKSDIKVAELGRYKVPLIASNVGCYAETIIDGETGYLIDPGPQSKKRWAEVLIKVIKDKDLRKYMGENLHKITEEYFDINKTVHNRLNFIQYYFDHVKS